MYLLSSFLIAIPIPAKPIETVVQANLQRFYVTFSDSPNLTEDKGGEFKNELFQKVTQEFNNPYYPQSNGILEKNPLIPESLHQETHTKYIRLEKHHTFFTV